MGLHFEWDDDKARINLKGHGVSFDEAKAVFIDPLARIFDDEAHSIDSVNAVLRAIITTMPKPEKAKPSRKSLAR